MTAVDWIYLTGIVLISAMVGLVCFRLGMAHERRSREPATLRVAGFGPFPLPGERRRDEKARKQARDELLIAYGLMDEWQCPNCGATTRARMADQ